MSRARLAALVVPVSLLAVVSTARAQVPENDDVAGAIDADPLPFMDSQNTAGAADNPEVGGLCTDILFHTVWYVLTVPQTGIYRITTAGTEFETSIGLHPVIDGAPVFGNECVAGFDAEFVLNLNAGAVFYIQVGSFFAADAGDLNFQVELVPEFTAEILVDSTGTVNTKLGVATITGTLQCSEPVTGDFQVEVKQQVKGGQGALTAERRIFEFPCPGEFSLDFASEEGFFKAGKVAVFSTFDACGLGGCVEEPAADVVQLNSPGKKK